MLCTQANAYAMVTRRALVAEPRTALRYSDLPQEVKLDEIERILIRTCSKFDVGYVPNFD
jgi:hypothetical protein